VLMLAALAVATPVPFHIPGDGAVAFKNNCTTHCPLIIMLHGASSDGQSFSTYSQMHYRFTGIIAYPSCVPHNTGWPIWRDETDSNWVTNLNTIQQLIALPDVDQSQVFTLGFSSGGFYTKALECAIGNQIKYSVTLAALKYVQPRCPYHTNVLHIHNQHDSYNTPIDPPNGTKGHNEIGYPTTMRSNWCIGASSCPINGRGNTTGEFVHFTASRPADSLSYDYFFYDGQPEHTYNVYRGVPSGAPDGLQMEDFIVYKLTGSVPPPSPPAPPTPPKPSKGCKAFENPTCKGVTAKTCTYYGCMKCHDDTSWDCDACCTPCSRTTDPTKGLHYCAAPAYDSRDAHLVEFLEAINMYPPHFLEADRPADRLVEAQEA